MKTSTEKRKYRCLKTIFNRQFTRDQASSKVKQPVAL